MPPTPTNTSYRLDDLSSPDPLASPFNDDNDRSHSAYRSRQSPIRKQNATSTRDLRRNSSAAPSLEHIAIPSSPFRTVSEQNLSPWKIRVTVEAEPEDMDSEGPRTRTMTQTMKIPLRQDSSPLGGAKSSRGRNSQPASAKSKRGSTPTRGQKSNSRSRRQSVTDLDARPLGDDAESDDWTKQKKNPSPRKRRSNRTRKSTGDTDAAAAPESSPVRSSRRRSSTAADFEVRQDTDAEVIYGQQEEQAIEESESGSPELRQIDLNRVSVRSRAMSTKSVADDNQDISDSSLLQNRVRTSTTKPVDLRKVSVNSAMSYPTPSPTSSYHGDSDDIGIVDNGDDIHETEQVGFDTVLESEGFTMIDLDTIPSARQYLSPVQEDPNAVEPIIEDAIPSPQELPSAGETVPESRSESVVRTEPITRQQPQPQPTIDYPTLNADDTEFSSTVPSSPPVAEKGKSLLRVPTSNLRKVTPITFSSPKLPSPPKQITRRTPHHQHRGSAGAVFAGIALQDVVSPDHPSDKSSTRGKLGSSSRSLEDDGLFGGFDAGTKRELRAGLRFGEELAKRQSSSPPAKVEPRNAFAKSISTNVDLQSLGKREFEPLTRHQPQTQIWRGETTVQRTPVQMFNPVVSKSTAVVRTPENPASKNSESVLMDTLARREREWQLDREAVSREIENASASQVIIIDSDDDESQAVVNKAAHIQTSTQLAEPIATNLISSYEEDDDEDIWLAEAKNSSSPHTQQPQPIEQNQNGFFSETEQKKQRDVAREAVSRPRRSLIPSPWKRGDDVPAPEEPSSLLSTKLEDQTGILFWEQQQVGKAKFESKRAQHNQLRPRRSSGKFDIDLMLGTPGKKQDYDSGLDLTGAKNQQADQEEDISQETDSHEAVEQIISSSIGLEEALQDPINNTFGEPDAIPSPEPPMRIPVNFNDSSMEISTTDVMHNAPSYKPAPLQSPFRNTKTNSESSPPRPPTPRSAMKGSRQISGPEMGFRRPDSPTMNRRVIFSERSRGVDVHGLESSFSMKSGSGCEDSTSGQIRAQLEGELLNDEDTVETSYGYEEEDTETELEPEQERSHEEPVVEVPTVSKSSDTKPGWRSWLWKDKKTNTEESTTVHQPDFTSAPVDTQRSATKSITPQDNAAQHPAWTQTISSTIPSSKHQQQTATAPTSKPSLQLPSYLLPPSYPSDPTRSLNTPLSTTGPFSNTHFRTLHIIYRKSLRPKFHAPKHIRPAVRRLLGTQMEIDESEQGVDRGVMTWTLGEGECEVLERFMQEVEAGYGVFPGADVDGSESGSGPVVWGWSVQQLAHWLCRIVVGEVVREEEARAKMKMKAKEKVEVTAKARAKGGK
ncbi:hypothetical protein LTR84_004146 [Exophiala bonariae]|uniref:Uncharacterized protein n=1 Tax=Exophiala bonariae TaxID=1690606 RepID=A0AAV9N899_9EURO|nr:hypothetical protein LTR84_004146 [Exophiala bonariae]